METNNTNEDKNSHSSKKTSKSNKTNSKSDKKETNESNKSKNEKNSNTNENNEEEKKEEEEEEEEEKPKFDPYHPDRENPYNNLNFETATIDELNYNDYIVLCYHCKNPIKIEDGWKIFECGKCHRLNKLPRKLINELYFDNKLKNVKYNSYMNHLDMILPLPFVIVSCPFCKASNKVKTNVKNCICFICEKQFEIDYSEDIIKPLEKVSLNPNSKFYRYQSHSANPRRFFPGNKIYRQSSYFFPEPVNYDNIFPFALAERGQLFLNNFKWNPQHQINYYNPNYYQINNFKSTDVNNFNNVIDKDEINEFHQRNQKRENDRANLYKNLFFMNSKN